MLFQKQPPPLVAYRINSANRHEFCLAEVVGSVILLSHRLMSDYFYLETKRNV